jgi:hypothetical protein
MTARDQATAIVMVCPVIAAAFRVDFPTLVALCVYAVICLIWLCILHD